MASRTDRSWLAAVAAAAGTAVFAALLFAVAKSFRLAIADIAEAETRVTVVNGDGTLHYDSGGAVDNHATREEVTKAFAEGRCSILRRSDTLGRDYLYCARRADGKVVRLAIPYTGVRRSELLVGIGLASAGVLGACLVLLIFVLTRRMSRRIEEQERRLEIAAAGERFRREFTANVAHELKSPITAIVGATEMLEDGSDLSAAERADLLKIVHNESGRLGALVGDVLSLAQIESERPLAPDGETLPLSDIVAAVAERERIKASAAHVRLLLPRNDAAQVRGDAVRLEAALQNLVANALRYSGSDRVEIESAVQDRRVRVSVTDYGIGIAAEHLPHVFERFYRVNKSRSRTLGGTGLGLAIVKHVVRAHGGEVFAESTPGIKTTFGFELPLAI